MKLFAYVCIITGVVCSAAAYSPIIDGAQASIRIKVVDETGKSVSGAAVSIILYTAPEKVDVKRGLTDDLGYYAAGGICIGEAYVLIRKSGYYDTKVAPVLQTLPDHEVQATQKWSKDEVQTTAVLKEKHHPVDLKVNRRRYWPFPVTNKVFSLDLETLQWCPPYGEGRHADLELFYEAVEHPEKGWAVSYWNKLTLKMPNAADGFYKAKIEPFSKFPYEYRADTNALFQKTLVLEVERRDDVMVKLAIPSEEEYFIYRTRTLTNTLGQLVQANYGRIGEKLRIGMGLTIRSWFNSTPNDTNLEDSRLR